MSERELRLEVCEAGRRLYARGLIAGADGNISVRLPRGRLLTTPSGRSKGFMRPEELVITDLEGRPMGGGKPSSELRLHLAVYRKREDVQSVIHAHPPKAVAFTVAGVSLEQCVMPEVLMYMGTVPTTRYATPSSEEGPRVIEEFIVKHDALLLDRHGAVTVGATVEEAWQRMEKLEHFAEVVLAARQLGAVRTLSADELDRLAKASAALGYRLDTAACQRCADCPRNIERETIASAVAEELKAQGIV